MTHFEHLEEFPYILKGRMNSFITTSFDDSMTVEMQIRVLIQWIKKNIDLTNHQTDYLNEFINTFDTKLEQTVTNVLEKWLDDGVISDIITDIILKIGDLDSFREEEKTIIAKMKREFSERGVNVKWFGAKGDGINDDGIAIQKAIDYAKGLFATFPQPTNLSNVIIIPTGLYKIETPMILPPYLKLESNGQVIFNSVIKDPLLSCLSIRFDKNDPLQYLFPENGRDEFFYGQEWQKGVLLNGDRGGISFICGLDKDIYKTKALEIGYRVVSQNSYNTNWANVARSTFRNVSIRGFNVGLIINTVDTFILNFEELNVQHNNTNISIGYSWDNRDARNTGENTYFNKCVIANGKVGLDCVNGGHDLFFQECAIDYNDLAIKGSEYANHSITINGGNLEGNKVIYDGSRSVNENVWRASLNLEKVNIYNQDWYENGVIFKSPLALNIDNPYLITTNIKATNKNSNGVLNRLMCSPSCLVTVKRNLGFKRGNTTLIDEKENKLNYGNRLEFLPYETQRKLAKTVVGGDVSENLRKLGISSSIKYTCTDTDTQGWEIINPTQKIDVRNARQFQLYGIIEFIASKVKAFNIDTIFYDDTGKQIEKTKRYFSIESTSVNYPITVESYVYAIPQSAYSMQLQINVTSLTANESLEIGYLRVMLGS